MTVPMVECPTCNGTGALPGGRCGTCSGAGRVTAHKASRLAPTSSGFLNWRFSSVSDADEYWADGAPDGSLHAFVVKPTVGPTSWKVSDLSPHAGERDGDERDGDEVLAEGSCPTVHKAKGEAEAFILSMLAPTSEELGEAKRGLLAVVAALAEPFE